MMPQNVRLLEENVGGVGISARDTDSRHRKGQMRRGIRAAIFTNGYFFYQEIKYWLWELWDTRGKTPLKSNETKNKVHHFYRRRCT